jgi:hypothetical protein
MFSREFQKLRRLGEIARALINHKWEWDPGRGIYIEGANVTIHGEYSIQHNKGGWSPWFPNLWPTEGKNFALDLIGNNVAVSNAYIALYANNYTPLITNTAATFTATYSEITSGSEGYTQATRVLWDTGAAAAAAINNNSVPAEFTMITASTVSAYGVALLTASAKGATTGKLLSAALFTGGIRTFSNTDLFDVKYQLGLS